MTVRLQLFAVARQLAGRDVIELDLPAAATVADLRQALAAAVPDIRPVLPHLMFAVNRQYADDAAIIPQAAELACIPPVSGG